MFLIWEWWLHLRPALRPGGRRAFAAQIGVPEMFNLYVRKRKLVFVLT